MLSIIIPTLNEEKYLPRLLESIKQQDYSDYEIIVSDGGSKDQTTKIASSNNCQVIVDSIHHHPSWQRNNGAVIAHGDILLFLDADTVLPPGFLANAIKEFQKRDLTIAGFFIKFNPNKWYYNIYSFTSNLICYFKQFSESPAAIGVGLMSKKEAHDEVRGFDLSIVLAEDYDYCDRLSKIGKFGIIKSPKILYSSRRIEQEGFFVAGWKWIKMGKFTLTNRKITKQIVKYDFGKF